MDTNSLRPKRQKKIREERELRRGNIRTRTKVIYYANHFNKIESKKITVTCLSKDNAPRLFDPSREEYCVSELGEGYYQCKWCPCRFSTIPDLEAHYEAFGRNESTHKGRCKEEMHRRTRSDYNIGTEEP